MHTGPVRHKWVSEKLGIPAQAIREDRILDEALASAGDARRISDLFGLSITSSTRYTNAVDNPGIGDYEGNRRAHT
ncbi:hypothetical protein [Phytohabitans aurantiacus]|uniref:Uncharacterized protein n=1 Tax=Phytohabitans aurantiacus TaxID=3016789 RepID=A0ABQ5R9A7_9ACTN|nr:hypothetical protein [Phytohabitans aurantiacus]GLI03346.1 hypothetical protein Pa4123_86240 [Phytohabitans aurantiacus]